MIDDGTRAPGHYGAGYGDPAVQHLGNDGPAFAVQGWHDDDHYRRLREEHARGLDEDYAHWRRERFQQDFGRWRAGRQETLAPEHESPLRSLGRAISETITGSRDPSPSALDRAASETDRPDRPADAGMQRELDQRVKTSRFYERA